MSLKFFNSDGRCLQEFVPVGKGQVGLYCCGPTVYNYAHIGNLRAYTVWDVLRRSLEYLGFGVKHVMNITDVGHLSDDADGGEDKMLRGARRQGRSVWEIAEYFTAAFMEDLERLNILPAHETPRATDHIEQMIDMIRILEEKGFSYRAGGNVYFDTSCLPDYGRMAYSGRNEGMDVARVEGDLNKKNPQDFVLWFTRSKFTGQAMLWDSPWGRGYPGWHIECSAMGSHYLGRRIDIHTGGVDHIPVHHSNEIAQSEAAFGERWVNYWLHNEFLIMKSGKMSKSEGGFISLGDLMDNGYAPLDYRYFLLGGHYRSRLSFSFSAMDSAAAARKSLMGRVTELGRQATGTGGVGGKNHKFRGRPGHWSVESRVCLEAFRAALFEDLNTPRALAELWGALKNGNIAPAERLEIARDMDSVLGLNLSPDIRNDEAPESVLMLARERENARASADWARADALREQISALDWRIVDESDFWRLEKK